MIAISINERDDEIICVNRRDDEEIREPEVEESGLVPFEADEAYSHLNSNGLTETAKFTSIDKNNERSIGIGVSPGSQQVEEMNNLPEEFDKFDKYKLGNC